MTLAGATVKILPTGEPLAVVEDVNGDLIPDLVLHFVISELQLTPQDTEAELRGKLFDGRVVVGRDSVFVLN